MCQKLNIKKNELKVKIKYQCHFNPLYLKYLNKYHVIKNATARVNYKILFGVPLTPTYYYSSHFNEFLGTYYSD
jgi:hypothetical protein